MAPCPLLPLGLWQPLCDSGEEVTETSERQLQGRSNQEAQPSNGRPLLPELHNSDISATLFQGKEVATLT